MIRRVRRQFPPHSHFNEQVSHPNYEPEELVLWGQPAEPEDVDIYSFSISNIGYDELDTQVAWCFHNERDTEKNRMKKSKIDSSLNKLSNQGFWVNFLYGKQVGLVCNLLN